MIMGIIGCVFTSKANSAYKSGDVQEYKRNSKSATICLWIGFAIALVWLVFSIIFSVLYSNDIEDAFMEGYNEAAGVSDDYDTCLLYTSSSAGVWADRTARRMRF